MTAAPVQTALDFPVMTDSAARVVTTTRLRAISGGIHDTSIACVAGRPVSRGVADTGHDRFGSLLLGVEAGRQIVLSTSSAEYLDDLIEAAQQLRDQLAYTRVTPARTGRE